MATFQNLYTYQKVGAVKLVSMEIVGWFTQWQSAPATTPAR